MIIVTNIGKYLAAYITAVKPAMPVTLLECRNQNKSG
jgi:hypothetical protein